VGKRFNRTLLAGLLASAPLFSHAAGLGRLTVMSALGQPLRAEIEVVSLERGEAESLAARLASADAFRQANLELSPTLQNLRFAVERRPNNRHVIVMTSPSSVTEPFLDILVELSWASGRLVREYTFLLDPPDFKGQSSQTAGVTPPAAVAAAKPAAQAPTAPAPAEPAPRAQAPAPRPVAPTPAPAPAPSAPAPAAAGGAVAAGTYQVASGDTLAKIAQQNMREGATLQQMLVALYRANEDAFINRNMNRLRAGRILTIPDAATVQGVSREEAVRTVNAQTQEWNAYRSQLAGTVAAGPARAEGPAQGAGGRITARVAEPAPAAGGDRLQIAQADPNNAQSAAGKAAKQDENVARERALREAQGRVSQLEKSVKDLERLLELKNQELARLQDRAKQDAAKGAGKAAPAPAATTPASKAEVIAKAPPAAEPVKPEAPKVEAPKVEAPKVEAPKVEAPKVEAPVIATPAPVAEAPQPAPATPAAPPAAPQEDKGLMDSVTEFVDENMLYVGGGALAIAGLVGGMFALRRRRANELEDSLMSQAPTDTSSVFGSTGGRSVDTGASSIATDFSNGGIGAIDTEEVDPVAEADVYMAYGRDAQAEEILKEALQKDPSRHAVRVKLLEIYAARKDLKAFETTAGELYAATGGVGPEWEKAAALGAQLDPGNTMYAAGAGAVAGLGGAAAAAAFNVDEGQPSLELPASSDSMFDAPPRLDDDAPADGNSAGEVEFDLDLGETVDHGLPPVDTVSHNGPTSEFNMDLELDALDADNGKDAPAPADDNMLEFDLGTPQSAAPSMDLGGISLDMGETAQATEPAAGVQLDPHWQEVATKLDLAKAYHEMGDREGAKELLGEVIREGDGAQQQLARRMLETIG